MAQERQTGSERTDTETVLEINDLHKDFGGITALDGANLEIREGEIVGLIGPNGAGKTTLFNCVMGVFPVTGGSIELRGEELTGRRTSDIVQQGLSRTFQIPRVFPSLTVRENMRANQNHAGEGMLRTMVESTGEDTEARIDELLGFVGLGDKADEQAGDLSTGQKKILNIVSTLLRDPEVVLLDEPTAGVNPALVDEITDNIVQLNREENRTFFVIEHNMDVMEEIADYAYMLSAGRNLTEGQPTEVLEDPRVLEAYFGE